MESSKQIFSEEVVIVAKKEVDFWFGNIVNGPGYGSITIEFRLEKNYIEVKPLLNFRFTKEKK